MILYIRLISEILQYKLLSVYIYVLLLRLKFMSDTYINFKTLVCSNRFILPWICYTRQYWRALLWGELCITDFTSKMCFWVCIIFVICKSLSVFWLDVILLNGPRAPASLCKWSFDILHHASQKGWYWICFKVFLLLVVLFSCFVCALSRLELTHTLGIFYPLPHG